MTRRSTPPYALVLLALLWLAFGLRVWGLADHNIWWDEGIGVWLARMPALDSVRWTAGDVHPPLYYLLLHAWRALAGEGEFVLRYPSALLSLLTVPVIYGLGRALGGRRAGMAAALFLALSRFAIAWGQEIRMYALASLAATGVLWAAVALWRERRGAWLAYVGATAAALYSLYLTATVPLVANVGFAVMWWRAGRPIAPLKRWLSAQVAAVLLLAPWLAYALPRMHSWASDSSFSPGFFAQLYATMLLVGAPSDLQAYLPWVLAGMAVFVLALGAAIGAVRRPHTSGGLAMLLAGILLPAVVVYAVSLPIFSFYYARPLTPRYLLPLAACFYALLGWGLARLAQRRRWLAWGAAAIVATVALVGLWDFYPGRARRDDYATIAATLQAHRQSGDRVLLYVDRDWPVFVAHYAGDYNTAPYGAAYTAAYAEALLAPLWESAEGVWLVQTPESLQSDPQQEIPRWLAARAAVWQTRVVGENSLTFYAGAARQASFAALAPAAPLPAGPRCESGGGRLLGATLPQSRYHTGDTLHLALYWQTPPDHPLTLAWETGGQVITRTQVQPGIAHGVVRQAVAGLLAPGMPGGRYRLLLEDAQCVVAAFTLIPHAAGEAVDVSRIQHPTDYRFGESIRLIGYDLPRTTLAPGEAVELTLYWQTTAVVSQRYKVFTHVLGQTYNASSDNFLWGQQDNEPGGGQTPTSLWAPGAVIVDRYRIPLAGDTPPGAYTLEVGMYGLVDVTRLPIFTAAGEPHGDALTLISLEVNAP